MQAKMKLASGSAIHTPLGSALGFRGHIGRKSSLRPTVATRGRCEAAADETLIRALARAHR